MPDVLITSLFLGVPLLAGAGASVAVSSAYSDLRSRPAEGEAVALARPRLPVFFALASVPFFFGLSLWLLVSGLEQGYGALQGPSYMVVFWMAAGYASVAVLALLSQAWLARARLRESLSVRFGRVLPVLVVPNTSLIFALVLGLLALARLPGYLAAPSTVSAATVEQFTVVFQVFAFSALANPVGIGLSLRVRDLATPQGFVRSLTLAGLATVAPLAALVRGFLQIGSL